MFFPRRGDGLSGPDPRADGPQTRLSAACPHPIVCVPRVGKASLASLSEWGREGESQNFKVYEL